MIKFEEKPLKQILRNILNKTGFDIIRTKHQHNSFKQHIKQVFHEKKIDCMLDVGANAGQYGKFLRDSGFDGWIVSFEPVKSDAIAKSKTNLTY